MAEGTAGGAEGGEGTYRVEKAGDEREHVLWVEKRVSSRKTTTTREVTKGEEWYSLSYYERDWEGAQERC
jgi:hypothetical protein